MEDEGNGRAPRIIGINAGINELNYLVQPKFAFHSAQITSMHALLPVLRHRYAPLSHSA